MTKSRNLEKISTTCSAQDLETLTKIVIAGSPSDDKVISKVRELSKSRIVIQDSI